ncbi:MAG: hypothetical protein PVI98_06130 [Burkholderiales bacterium]|jgi:hypothetical protein
MPFRQNIKKEVVSVITLTLYFACWIGVLVLLKYLVLAEYQIAANNLTVALVGALILAKVVLVLEHVQLGSQVRRLPAWVDVLLRTVLYSLAVFLVVVLEKSFEARHDYGGFSAAISELFRQTNAIHIWTNTICLSAALLSYNMLSVVRKHLGKGALLKMFLVPLPQEPKD